MNGRKRYWLLAPILGAVLVWGGMQGLASAKQSHVVRAAPKSDVQMQLEMVTNAQRRAAATKLATFRKKQPNPLSAAVGALTSGANPFTAGIAALTGTPAAATATLTPNAVPDYYNVPNYANSPLPEFDATGNVLPNTGIRKFVDSLPGLGAAGANNLGQFIPVAVPDQTTYPGADYYVIALVQYTEKLHSDLPPTLLRGYVQLNSNGTSMSVPPMYAGPTIIAQKDRPVRVKFINKLPTGTGGNLFLPVDTGIMGAGAGPNGGNYTENRATLHLHGGLTPWISDGTPHQWTTPATENTPYQEGVSVHNVPDMDGGHEPTGTLTFYYTNQQSARLMFYHDHTYGLTRLNVYAGEAAPYVLQDPVEQKLVNGGSFKANGTTVTVAAGTIPAEQIPLVIQDKTFVPKDSQLASSDPTWDKARWGGFGQLWLPHVYMPNQISGNDIFGNELGGVSAMGRWDYNPWFYPPIVTAGGQTQGTPVPNPLWGQVGEPAQNPGTPLPTIIPESFMDTPMVNGTPYPYVKVGRKAYRFRILNACDDRTLNLQIYFAKSNTPDAVDASGNPLLQTASGDVSMTVAAPHPGDPTWPSRWPTDGRDGGVPDPATAASGSPEFIQIGNEGGFLPSATVLPNTPVGYEYFRRTITVLNVSNKTLFLGPAERADVIVDFSGVPDGTKLILYNDAPAPVPAFDARLDYYTGDPDQTTSGGAPTTLPGYGPNTRTVMQFQVSSAIASSTPFNIGQLQTGLQAAYAATQDKPIVPEAAYSSAFATSFPNNYVHTTDTTMTFKPMSQNTTATFTMQEKAIIEGFDMEGRMNAQLGGTLPNLGPQFGAATPYDYVDPPTDIATNTIPGTQIGALNDGTQIWRLDHQGVDTHAIHFHLFNVELINRIALDGQLFYPDANELGWKETVRMNPGQDVIVAIRPVTPTLPWKLPDSVRVLNPALPEGATFTDSLGTVVTNSMTNFGWEYVWHCHLLGHEENDMMRPFVFEVSPAAPTVLTGAPSSGPVKVTLHWTNNDTFPAATNYLVQRSTNAAFTTGLTSFTVNGRPTTYVDTAVAGSTVYHYRVRAETSVSYSDWTNVVTATTPAASNAPLARTNVVISAITRTSLRVGWTNPVGGTAPTSLRVQISTAGTNGPWTTVSTLAPTATFLNITGLRRNTNYWIRVQAINGNGTTSSPVVATRTLP